MLHAASSTETLDIEWLTGNAKQPCGELLMVTCNAAKHGRQTPQNLDPRIPSRESLGDMASLGVPDFVGPISSIIGCLTFLAPLRPTPKAVVCAQILRPRVGCSARKVLGGLPASHFG